jgi:hypothetical protein
MISRLLVPPNARISSGESNETKAVRRDHLVPRRLISADTRMSDAPSEAVSPAGETASASGRLMVPNLLVPPGARIDTPLTAAIPVTASANVLDEALLGDSFAGHRHTAAEWLISIGVHAAIVAAVLISLKSHIWLLPWFRPLRLLRPPRRLWRGNRRARLFRRQPS